MKHLWNQSSYRCHDAASIVGRPPSKRRDNRVLSVDDFSSSLHSQKDSASSRAFERTESLEAAQKQCVVFNHWEQ
jgi:hypothetical protein